MDNLKHIQWSIPKKHILTTTVECNDLLNSGYTLINNMGYIVFLREDGTQYKANKHRKRAYRFSNPQLWQVLGSMDSKATALHIINTKSIGFKINTWIMWLGNKLL